VCGRGSRSLQTKTPPSSPCPLCSTARELQTLANPDLLPFAPEVIPELRARKKQQALNEIVDALVASSRLGESEGQGILNSLGRREPVISTEIGCGVAIVCHQAPHIGAVLGAFARSMDGVECGIPDARPIQLVFVVISPADQPGLHLGALQKIARYLIACGVQRKGASAGCTPA
jgi:mannitol/fructose-specific phosphotransferase system IIA component (Ntr-type)